MCMPRFSPRLITYMNNYSVFLFESRMWVLLSVLMTSAISASATPTQQEVDSLLIEVEKIQSVSGLLNGRVVYSDKQLSHYPFRRKNARLKATYIEVVESFQNKKNIYYDLSLGDWAKVTTRLLEVDELISAELGWGNLVVKCFILDLIQSSIYLRAKKGGDLDLYLSKLKVVMTRLPSRAALLYIAIDHSGFSTSFWGITGSKGISSGGQHISDAAEIYKSLEKNEDLVSHVNVALGKERSVRVDGYRDLIEKELVWKLVMLNSFEQVFFDLHMYVCSKAYAERLAVSIASKNFRFSHMFDKCSPEQHAYLRHWDAEGYASARGMGKIGGSSYELGFVTTQGEMDLSNVWSGQKKYGNYWFQGLMSK